MSEKTDKSKLKKLKHVKVYDQLYEQIKNGTYPPEAQLPPETDSGRFHECQPHDPA